ncbi:hypothetical protein VUR80DRAFT_2764 [Thermomyces stellatus]
MPRHNRILGDRAVERPRRIFQLVCRLEPPLEHRSTPAAIHRRKHILGAPVGIGGPAVRPRLSARRPDANPGPGAGGSPVTPTLEPLPSKSLHNSPSYCRGEWGFSTEEAMINKCAFMDLTFLVHSIRVAWTHTVLHRSGLGAIVTRPSQVIHFQLLLSQPPRSSLCPNIQSILTVSYPICSRYLPLNPIFIPSPLNMQESVAHHEMSDLPDMMVMPCDSCCQKRKHIA